MPRTAITAAEAQLVEQLDHFYRSLPVLDND